MLDFVYSNDYYSNVHKSIILDFCIFALILWEGRRIYKKVTIDIVAKEAKVSKSTVSRFINNLNYISDETRDRIKKVIDKYNYKPNISAKTIRTGMKDTVALITSQTNVAQDGRHSAYFSEFLSILNIELSKYKFHAMLKTIPDDIEKDDMITDLNELIMSKRISFVIILGELKNAKIIDFLKNSTIPILFHSWEYDKFRFDTVMGDDFSGIQEAIAHLVSLGHKDIGLINGETIFGVFKKRLSFFKLGLLENDLQFHPEWVVETKNNYLSGVQAFTRIKALSNNLPTAFFCMTDTIAFGVMDAIKVDNTRIPEDISVIGYDNLMESANTYPPLTTIDSSMEESARVVVNKMIMSINNPDKHLGTIIVPSRLIIRKSTGSRKQEE